MIQSTVSESQLSLVQQKQPWERLPNESAKWFFRFRNFLALGPKRSVRAVYDAEQQQKATKGRGNPGTTWYSVVRKFDWWRRAEAWDAEQSNQKAAMLRQIAMKCAFVSRPFRITQLNSAATTLMMELEKGHEPAVFLAMVKQLRELMHDIQDECESWNVPISSACDAAALQALEAKSERQKELQQEREMIAEEEADFAIAQLVQKQHMLQEQKERFEKLMAGEQP